MRRRVPSLLCCAGRRLRRGRAVLPTVAAVAVGLLVARAAWPAPAHAVDLFPVDDWLGDGIKKAGDVVLGPLEFGAEEIAKLLATIVGALADLLVPKSLVRAGVDGIRWLVSLPAVGAAAVPTTDGGYALSVRMPHVVELRQTLTWIGVTLLPVGLVLAGGRAILAPSTSGDGPAEILIRVCVAGLALISYDLVWAQLTRLCRLITDALLRLPWVDDGIERMLETLVIGGAAGTAVAAEFVIPLLIMVAGGALLALLLLRVGLEVATALLYVLGGLVLGLSPTEFGRRLMLGWLFAATAIVVLPVLWTIVFVTGAALMLDAGSGPGGGFGRFVSQLFNVAAAVAVFGIAIKLALGVFAKAQSSIASLGATQLASSPGRMPRPASSVGVATPAGVPASLASFSRNLRAGSRGAARAAGGAAGFPVRHPVSAVQGAGQAVRHPVQATQQAASGLRDATRTSRTRAPDAAAGTARSTPVQPNAATNGIVAASSAPPSGGDVPDGIAASRGSARSGRRAVRAPRHSAASTETRSAPAQPRADGIATGSASRLLRPHTVRVRKPRPIGAPSRGPMTSTALAAARRAAGAPRPAQPPGIRPGSPGGSRPATAPPTRMSTRRRKPRPLTPEPKRGPTR